MRTDEERLIDLLSTAGWNLFQNPISDKKLIAKHLLENGVTFKDKEDFKEVKHGYWKKTTYVEVRRCSICNKPLNISQGMPKYCPDCGAILDKEKRK